MAAGLRPADSDGKLMNDTPKEERSIEELLDNSESIHVEGQSAPADGDFEVLTRLMKENEELKDRALRAAAEMENLRRRTARDVQDARNYAIANFARDMLSVSDNLRRAIDAVPADGKAAEGGLKALMEGVEVTERSMISALERHGVKKLAPEGEKFDPNFHQAMFEIPNPDVPAQTVLQVVQPGYSIADRVLRPAMVGVSSGGPRHQAANNAGSEPGPVNEQAERDA